MKKLLFLLSLCFLSVGGAMAQCTFTSSFGSGTINTTGTAVTLSTCSFAGEFSTISGAVAGQTLKFTSSIAGDEVTIHTGSSNGPVIGFGVMPFTLANTFTGTLFAHWSRPGCVTQSTCRTTTVQCTSCTVALPDPCSVALLGTATCGVNQTVTLSGSGANWNPSSCGFSTPGAEKVYTFTAPFTGAYTLNVTGGTGGFVDWFFKPTSAGCGPTGWTCILDISASGSPSFNLTAGTYFILADGEGTTSRTQTFNISCVPPIDPCNTILPAVCGVSQTVTLSGAGGGWNPSSCGFSTPGAEQVYSFTAPTTGTYIFNVTNGTGGFVDWFFKPTSAGCGPTGWTCIDDISGSGAVSFTLTAGTYYILGDGEGTTSRTQSWSITCPQPAPSNDLCSNPITISCGQTVTGSTQFATADVAPSCNGFAVGTAGAVWYKLIGTGGFVTLSTCSAGTDYDTKLHVYDGSCNALNCVTANDDDANCTTGPGTAGFKSTVTFCTTLGTPYLILVNGFSAAAGNFALSADCNAPAVTINAVAPLCESAAAVTLSANLGGGVFSGPGVSGNSFNPAAAGAGVHTITYTLCSVTATTTITVLATPANDLVGNAAPLACGASAVGNTTCATSETLGTCGTTDGTGGGVWYSMVGNGNKITLTTCNSVTDFDTKLRVFTGSPSALTCLGGIDDDANCTTGPGTAGFKSTFSFCSIPGETYYILVHGFSSAVGNFKLESSCGAVNPTISCGGPVAANLDANCQFLVPDYTSLASASDDCGVTSVTQSPAAGSTITGAGTYAIAITATDAGGNTASCNISLTLTDITPPSAVCQDLTAILDGGGNTGVTASAVNNGSSDACGIASIAIDNGSFSCANTGANTVTLTVVDINGLSSTCTAVVTVVDNEAPVIECNSGGFINGPSNNNFLNDVELPNDLGQCGAVFTWDNTVSDNCPNVTVAQVAGLVPGTLFPVGTTTNTFVATDASGNTSSCSFNVTVNDIEFPVANCQNATVSLDATGNGSIGVADIDFGSTDNCGIDTEVLNNTSFTCANVGANTVILTVTDVHGNVSTCSSIVTVNDLVAPVAICQNVTVSLDAAGQGSTSAAAVNHGSSDACGIASLSLNNSSFTCANVAGPNTVILTVTDVNGNATTCSASVTVRDLVAPVITCPANITVNAPTGQCSTTVAWVTNATDACGIASIVSNPASGSVFGTGTRTVTSVATDVNGNTSSCSFTVRVNAVGTITLWGVPCNRSALCSEIPAAPSVVPCPVLNAPHHCYGGGHHGSHNWGTNGSGHHCNGGGHHGSHSWGNGGSGGGSSCNYQGSGSGWGSGYHGYNGLSGNGQGHNSGNHSGCNHGNGGSGSGGNYCVGQSCGVYATSVCGPCPTVVMTTTTIPGSCANNYQLVRTWTATDAFGNTLSQSQTISVYDNVRPTIDCPSNITVCVPMNGNSRNVSFNVTGSDNCGTPTIVSVPASGSSFALGNTNVTATATDACGNTRTCTFRVRVERRNNCNSKTVEEETSGASAEEVTGLSINAFPNPTTGMVDLEIMCQDCADDHTYELSLSDLYGKQLGKQNVSIVAGKANMKLDLSQYAAGIYMVTINNMMVKIVKN